MGLSSSGDGHQHPNLGPDTGPICGGATSPTGTGSLATQPDQIRNNKNAPTFQSSLALDPQVFLSLSQPAALSLSKPHPAHPTAPARTHRHLPLRCYRGLLRRCGLLLESATLSLSQGRPPLSPSLKLVRRSLPFPSLSAALSASASICLLFRLRLLH
ncbi:hypothetical protein Droror1_Dr00017977, partial [Drosera rotundifolia]